MKIPFPRLWHAIITTNFIQDLRHIDIQCTVISVLLLGRLKREKKTTRFWPAWFNAGKLKQRKHKTMESLVCQESDTFVLGQEVHIAVKMKNQNPQMGAEPGKRSPGSVMSNRLACAGMIDVWACWSVKNYHKLAIMQKWSQQCSRNNHNPENTLEWLLVLKAVSWLLTPTAKIINTKCNVESGWVFKISLSCSLSKLFSGEVGAPRWHRDIK